MKPIITMDKKSIIGNLIFTLVFTIIIYCIMSIGNDTVSKADIQSDIQSNIETSEVWQEIIMNVSAYCPCEKCCGEYADGQTANGHWIKEGERFVAAPKKYPFGTEMIIHGYNEGRPVKVLDRGGSIKGNKLDLYFDNHQEALNFGRQEILVKIKKE